MSTRHDTITEREKRQEVYKEGKIRRVSLHDGSKALHKAVKQTFGEEVKIQRYKRLNA